MEENNFSSPKPSGRQDARRERKTKASTVPIEEDVTVEVVDVGADKEEVEVMKIGPTMIKNQVSWTNLRLSVTTVMNTGTLQKSVSSQTVENNGQIWCQNKVIMNQRC
jgi:hypothetical protein